MKSALNGLPGEAGARAAGQHRHPVLGGERHRGGDVPGVPRIDHHTREDRVHAGVAGEQVPGVVVVRDLPVEPSPQRGDEHLAYESLPLPGTDEHRLVVYLPADADTSDALAALAVLQPGTLDLITS